MVKAWFSAEGCFIPKEKNASKMGQFRTISLLNVEGKLFLAVLARRMTNYMLENKYIDISVRREACQECQECQDVSSI